MHVIHRAFKLGVLTCLFAACGVAQSTDKYADRHLACYVDSLGALYRLEVNSTGSTFSSNATPAPYLKLVGPANSWPEGLQFASAMQLLGLFPTSAAITGASWTRDEILGTREDMLTFTAADGIQYTFASAACPEWTNCRSLSGGGRHCWTDVESCCGAGTMTAGCVDTASADQCCTWFQASAVCNSSQTCCGMRGPLATSYAFCCDQGSTCCNAQVPTDGSASCCPANTKCCAAASVGLCCAADEECDVAGNRCVATAASTVAPADSDGPTQPSEATAFPITAEVTATATPDDNATTAAAPQTDDAPVATEASTEVPEPSNVTSSPGTDAPTPASETTPEPVAEPTPTTIAEPDRVQIGRPSAVGRASVVIAVFVGAVFAFLA